MQDIHDIKGIIEVIPFWHKPLFLILTIIAFCLIILLFLFLYFKNKKKKSSLLELIIPKLTPYEEAIQALLDSKKFMQPGLDKLLSTKLSDLIRHYLEDAFYLQSYEKTTEEFLHNIQQDSAFNTKSLETLSIFLEMADLAKFANVEFTHNEQKTLIEKASLFLELAHKEEIKTIPINQEIKKGINLE